MSKLNRALGLKEVVFFGTGSILGAGIYSIIGKVAGYGGNMTWLAFGIAATTALATAFSYAELSSMFPKAGGEYVYVKKAMNQKTGFILGLIISLNGMVSGATVSIAFAGYFSRLWDINLFIASAGIILLVWLVNTIGIRQSSTVNIIFTLIEFGGLLLILYIAAPYFGKVNYFELPPGGTHHILLAAALSYFAYVGFEEIVKLSEETRSPEKNIPRALFTASGIVMITYMLVAICAVSAIPWEALAESKHPLSEIVKSDMGKTGMTIIAVIALFSTTNTILSNMLGSSRVLMQIGQNNEKLRWLSYVMPRQKTPVPALILVAAIMMAFAMIGKLETVALIANFFIFIVFIFVNITAIVLRFKQKAHPRPYRIPLNVYNIPLPSVAGLLLTLALLGYSIYGLTMPTE